MKKIFSILVAYNPNLEELNQAVERLKKQTNIVVVCNNSNYDVNFKDEKVKVFNFGENLGIAKAQSIGMKWAFENGADFILQMDQDSIPSDDFVVKLLNCYELLSEKGYNVGLVGSQDYDKDTMDLSKPKINRGVYLENESYIQINQVISSGSLIPIETYNTVGGMDDDLFIDAVDFEYCWRVVNNGFIIIKNVDSLIAHKLGNGISSLFFIKYISPSPIRHYYQFRNLLLLFRKSYVPFYWKISTLIKCLLSLIFLPFLFEQKNSRFRYMIKGISDGMLSKKGRIDNAK